jgi:RNA polymerase sigma factor (sigma-70 family)
LFVRELAELRRFARRLVRDEDSLDDLVQDVALKLLEHPHVPDDAGTLSLWCRGAARHMCMHRRRSFARFMMFLHAFETTAGNGILEDFERAAIARDQLAAATSGLDDSSLRLLVERYVDGATSSEIAARRQVSATSIRMRLARLRCAVRSAIDAEGEVADARDEEDCDDSPVSGRRSTTSPLSRRAREAESGVDSADIE